MNKHLTKPAWIVKLCLAFFAATIFLGCTPVDEERELVLEVVDIQLAAMQSRPPQLQITALGNVSSSGWSNAELEPVKYNRPPPDGIYEFKFYAKPPAEDAATVITPIEASHQLSPMPANLKGVRIIADSNELVLMLDTDTPPPSPTPTPTPVPEIISDITGVQLSVLTDQRAQVEIHAQGNVSSAGWSNPQLIPHVYVQAPQDGIYEYTFYASPPKEPAATVITPIEVTHRLNAVPGDFRGVRIYAANNNMEALLNVPPPPPPPQPEIINEITDVQLLTSSSGDLTINARGNVISTGWTGPVLVAHQYIVPPQDGIYDYTFYATPPDGPSGDAITPIEAIHKLGVIGSDFKGVRIHSATNSMEALLDTAPTPPPEPEIISEITGVKLNTDTNGGLIITAQGNVNTAGWTDPVLVPVQYIVPPQDGIYDFTFYATPPGEPAATVITPIETRHRLDVVPPDLKGVRIHAVNNNMVALLPPPIEPPLPPQIISEVTDVQLFVTSSAGGLVIQAKGNVTSTGWSNPVLVPVQYVVPPQDGIYDFTFYATPPSGPALTVITPIETVYTLDAVYPDLKGVRIHAANNNMTALLDPPQPPTQPEIINEVTDVQLLRGPAGEMLIVARGIVTSAGWSNATLVAHQYVVPPQDGIYEYTFYAQPPGDPVATVLTPIEARQQLNAIPSDLKGVRVYAVQNSVEALLEQPADVKELIWEVRDVQLAILESLPEQLSIHATGFVTSGGWSSGELVPIQTINPPADGIYDFNFVAAPPPSGEGSLTVISPIEASLVLPTIPPDLKGVRIHAQSNVVETLIQPPVQPLAQIIYAISDVRVSVPPDTSGQLDIAVMGVVNSGGWSQPMLVATPYNTPPADGIYEYTFYAVPPDGPAADAFMDIELVHRLSVVPTDMKGIRVVANTNSVEVPFVNVCADCGNLP